MRWQNVHDGALHIPFGKTENARRTVPLTPRCAVLLETRRSTRQADWVFPAPTRSGHIEKSTLKKQHAKALKLAQVEAFTLYTLRHTCLTRWAAHMDPYTLAYLAGHSDFSTTKRYVHPQAETVRAAMERARGEKGGHSFGHSDEKAADTPSAPAALTTSWRKIPELRESTACWRARLRNINTLPSRDRQGADFCAGKQLRFFADCAAKKWPLRGSSVEAFVAPTAHAVLADLAASREIIP